MVDVIVTHRLTIKPKEALFGTEKLITRKGKRLEVIIPPGVKTGTQVKLSGALQITDGYYGDLFIQIKVKNTHKIVYAISAIVILFIVISSITIARNINTSTDIARNINTSTDGYVTVFNNEQPEDFTSYGKPIELVNNHAATNPTWEELKDFLVSDKTDEQPYIEYAYECASYAEEVHNHAEARGIKAAFVAVFFQNENDGHALNAFQTKDKGLVYVDCSDVEGGGGYDTVAYIEKGKDLGFIEIDQAKSFDYSYYYNFYEREFAPLGIVKKVYIYW